MDAGFRMAVGSDLGDIARVAAALDRFAEARGVPAGVRRSVQVALDDLLSNTITHGFAGRSGGTVTVEARLTADALSVTLTDDAAPFDPSAAAAPDTSLTAEQRLPGGLGIHLVRRLMDDVRYERRGGHNIVTVSKRLAAQERTPESGERS